MKYIWFENLYIEFLMCLNIQRLKFSGQGINFVTNSMFCGFQIRIVLDYMALRC